MWHRHHVNIAPFLLLPTRDCNLGITFPVVLPLSVCFVSRRGFRTRGVRVNIRSFPFSLHNTSPARFHPFASLLSTYITPLACKQNRLFERLDVNSAEAFRCPRNILRCVFEPAFLTFYKLAVNTRSLSQRLGLLLQRALPKAYSGTCYVIRLEEPYSYRTVRR